MESNWQLARARMREANPTQEREDGEQKRVQRHGLGNQSGGVCYHQIFNYTRDPFLFVRFYLSISVPFVAQIQHTSVLSRCHVTN